MAGPQRIVAIGSSAGGVEALKHLASRLPSDFAAPVVMVQHLHSESRNYLPHILGRAGPLPVEQGADRALLKPGHIYIAPPDHHMLVYRNGYIRLTRGPRENRARPAIDPLFRSVALAYGNRALGVVLTGALDDGTSGLAAIKGCGGLAVVQDPDDAAVRSMPQSALRHVVVDHVVPLAAMATLLHSQVEAEPPADPREVAAMKRNLELELKLASGDLSGVRMEKLGTPSLFTCPECQARWSKSATRSRRGSAAIRAMPSPQPTWFPNQGNERKPRCGPPSGHCTRRPCCCNTWPATPAASRRRRRSGTSSGKPWTCNARLTPSTRFAPPASAARRAGQHRRARRPARLGCARAPQPRSVRRPARNRPARGPYLCCAARASAILAQVLARSRPDRSCASGR